MKTVYYPSNTSNEVRTLESVNTEKIIESLQSYISKLSTQHRQVGLRCAEDFEGIGDLRYQENNPTGYTQEDFKFWQPETEYIQEVAQKIGIGPVGRVRLLLIGPQSCYSFHCDPHKYRVHIPLITNPGAFMIVWGKIWHLPLGYSYRVRVSEEHSAVNTGNTNRVHLVFDYCDYIK